MSGIVVGIDGGGSKTLAIVADDAGETLGRFTGPASALRSGDVEQSAAVIAEAVRGALAAAKQGDAIPRSLCAGIAGVGREADRLRLEQAVSRLGIADSVSVDTDFSIALDDAFRDGPGVLLIAGTGSVAFGRSPAGATARCGGWGPVCGDEGSGAWIGRRALSIVTGAADGREPETALTGALLTTLQLDETNDLIAWAGQASTTELAALAQVVMGVANAGDLRANALVALAVEELVLHVRSLARQLFVDERAAIPVALSGGLMKRGSLLRKRLEHRLRSLVPGSEVRSDPVDAARGAVRRALLLVAAAR